MNTKDQLVFEIIRRNGVDGRVNVSYSIVPWHDDATDVMERRIEEGKQEKMDHPALILSDTIVFEHDQRMASVFIPMKTFQSAVSIAKASIIGRSSSLSLLFHIVSVGCVNILCFMDTRETLLTLSVSCVVTPER